jgi:hypothetical protein
MTRKRKRRRTEYVLLDWARVVDEVIQTVNQTRKPTLDCFTAVIAGDVVKVSSSGRFETVAESQQVHGHWLPAQFTLESSQARYVVRVDLVRRERQTERTRKALAAWAAGDVRNATLPVRWTLLYVATKSPRVVHARQLTEQYALQLTQVTVLPLPPQPGRLGQAAVSARAQVAPSDLLRVALDAAQLHGVLRSAAGSQYPSDVGRLQARRRPVDPATIPATRQAHTLELLRLVRDVHQAAPHGSKLPAVMQHQQWERSKAEKLVRESQERLQWGLAHERSKKSTTQRNKGGKT